MNVGWMDDALCARVDPELFARHKGRTDMTRKAKRICQTCSATEPCLQYAMSNPDIGGILGGTTERERRNLRRRTESP